MDRYSFLNAVHSEYVEELYQKYLEFPDSVEPSWKSFFQGYDFAKQEYDGEKIDFSETVTPTEVIIPEKVNKEFKVINLINGYRQRGHLFTKTNRDFKEKSSDKIIVFI